MATWRKDNLCSRPFAWWEFEAPEPREMVGGSGVQAHTVCNYKQAYVFGVPKIWTEIDEADAPLAQSQAAYLQDRGYLSSKEEKYLKDHPAAPEPENIFNILKRPEIPPGILFAL